MVEPKKCARCKSPTPTIDNITDTTTYYGFQMKTDTQTTVRKSIRLIIWRIAGRFAKRPGVLQADEEQPLCFDCGRTAGGQIHAGTKCPSDRGEGKTDAVA